MGAAASNVALPQRQQPCRVASRGRAADEPCLPRLVAQSAAVPACRDRGDGSLEGTAAQL